MNDKGKLNKTRLGTCTKDCYGSCVFKGFWNDKAPKNKFLYAEPLRDHPFTNGFFCPKFIRRQELVYHKERIKNPLIRVGPKNNNNFKKISLKNALSLIVDKIVEIQKEKNSASIIGAYYSGNMGLISQFAPLRFFSKIGATITSGGICNEGGCAGLKLLFGTYSTTNPFQLTNPSTKLIVIWGTNLSESNNHAYYLVKQALRKGIKLVVVDSRCTLIAKKADFFLQVFPGTEHLLVKLIINELIKRNACDKEFLKSNVDFEQDFFLELTEIDNKKLLSQVEIDNNSIQNFVDLLITFKHHTIFNIGFGIQKDFYGGRIVKTIALIQIILGNIGKPGTGLIYSQSDFLKPLVHHLKDYLIQKGSESKFKEIPIIKLGSELSTENYKMLFVYNFNPASSLPNQNQLRNALMNTDLFIVVLDMFLNETTKYADIVIPAKFDLESNDLIFPYYIPGVSINIGGPCSYQNCVTNYEFFQQLAWKLGYEDDLMFQESEDTIFNNCIKMLPSEIKEEISFKGYYLLFDENFIPFSNFEFPTPDNRINAIGTDFNFRENKLKQRFLREKNEFLLISPSHYHFLHSQLEQLNSKYTDVFSKIFLIKKDIDAVNLEIGCKVLVSNEYGSEIYILAESSIIKPGTALIYSGVSSTLKNNPNVNFFTPDQPEELGFSGAYNSALVKITKIDS